MECPHGHAAVCSWGVRAHGVERGVDGGGTCGMSSGRERPLSAETCGRIGRTTPPMASATARDPG